MATGGKSSEVVPSDLVYGPRQERYAGQPPGVVEALATLE